MNFTLEIHNFTKNKIDEALFERVAEIALKTIIEKKPSPDLRDRKAEISLAVVGDARMRRLNKFYRGQNRVTDVLSFDNKSVIPFLGKVFPDFKENQEAVFVEAPDDVSRLGEVIICYPRAKKQARQAGRNLENELTTLLIHAILHLTGYDHEKSEREAEEMEKMQDMILAAVGKN